MHMAERFVFIPRLPRCPPYLHPTTRRYSLNQTPPSYQPLPIPEGRPGISNLVETVTENTVAYWEHRTQRTGVALGNIGLGTRPWFWCILQHAKNLL